MKATNVLKGLVAAGLLLTAGAASANQLSSSRGYDRCLDDLEGSQPRHARLVHARYYYQSVGAEEMTFFVNSTAWQDGDRVHLRTRCETDRGGFALRSRDTTLGRWVPDRGRVTVEEVSSR